jgi:hypothetical protein
LLAGLLARLAGEELFVDQRLSGGGPEQCPNDYGNRGSKLQARATPTPQGRLFGTRPSRRMLGRGQRPGSGSKRGPDGSCRASLSYSGGTWSGILLAGSLKRSSDACSMQRREQLSICASDRAASPKCHKLKLGRPLSSVMRRMVFIRSKISNLVSKHSMPRLMALGPRCEAVSRQPGKCPSDRGGSAAPSAGPSAQSGMGSLVQVTGLSSGVSVGAMIVWGGSRGGKRHSVRLCQTSWFRHSASLGTGTSTIDNSAGFGGSPPQTHIACDRV